MDYKKICEKQEELVKHLSKLLHTHKFEVIDGNSKWLRLQSEISALKAEPEEPFKDVYVEKNDPIRKKLNELDQEQEDDRLSQDAAELTREELIKRYCEMKKSYEEMRIEWLNKVAIPITGEDEGHITVKLTKAKILTIETTEDPDDAIWEKIELTQMYPKAFVEWIVDSNNVMYNDGVYFIFDLSEERGHTLNQTFDHWKTQVNKQ